MHFTCYSKCHCRIVTDGWHQNDFSPAANTPHLLPYHCMMTVSYTLKWLNLYFYNVPCCYCYLWHSWSLKVHVSTEMVNFAFSAWFSHASVTLVLPTTEVDLICMSTTHTHTHTFHGHFSGTTQVRRYQKGKTNLDFTEARDSEWQRHQLGYMQVCTSPQTDNHTSTPPLKFFYRLDALPATQPTASKHRRRLLHTT